jgi:hypothetical protein
LLRYLTLYCCISSGKMSVEKEHGKKVISRTPEHYLERKVELDRLEKSVIELKEKGKVELDGQEVTEE